jgi:hypothetical protein
VGKVYSTHREKRKTYRISVGCQKEREHKEDLGIGGKIILKWILEHRMG